MMTDPTTVTDSHFQSESHGSVHPPPDAAQDHKHHLHLPHTTIPARTLDDASAEIYLTETKQVEPVSIASAAEAPARSISTLRKSLTAVGAATLGFRLAEIFFSLITIVVMCSNSERIGLPGSAFGHLKFNHFQAYRYLVAINVLVFLYSTLQFVQLAYTIISGIALIPSIFMSTWITFASDQGSASFLMAFVGKTQILVMLGRCNFLVLLPMVKIFAYLLISASTSAATAAMMAHNGEMGIHICSDYGLHSFCARADVSVTMSFFTFFAMAGSTVLAVYRVAVLLQSL